MSRDITWLSYNKKTLLLFKVTHFVSLSNLLQTSLFPFHLDEPAEEHLLVLALLLLLLKTSLLIYHSSLLFQTFLYKSWSVPAHYARRSSDHPCQSFQAANTCIHWFHHVPEHNHRTSLWELCWGDCGQGWGVVSPFLSDFMLYVFSSSTLLSFENLLLNLEIISYVTFLLCSSVVTSYSYWVKILEWKR